ncbi:MAG: glycosyltransferase family 9 protein [Burkholderiales bacterium]|nr:glycosyltransferase family 9 protein [Burkholderiales bacterium]
MNEPLARPKLLVMQFKYLGDVVVATPVLRALREALPHWELHLLVPSEATPLVARLPWLDRVWGFHRARGGIGSGEALAVIRALRRERYAVSIDLAGNDRGALVTRLVGARRRIGRVAESGHRLRRACYTDPVEDFDLTRHESLRSWAITAPLAIPPPRDMRMEIAADEGLFPAADAYLDGAGVLCHVTASQPKREWPARHWAEFHRMAAARGLPIAFTGGNSARERQSLATLAAADPRLPVLPPPEPLEFLLAVISRARAFVSGDAGPMHFAAGLGVPTVSLFGPTSAQRWAPLGPRHRWLQGGLCPCSGHAAVCRAEQPCMAHIAPDAVLAACEEALAQPR